MYDDPMQFKGWSETNPDEEIYLEFEPDELSFYRESDGFYYRYADLTEEQRRRIWEAFDWRGFKVLWGMFWQDAYLRNDRLEVYVGGTW